MAPECRFSPESERHEVFVQDSPQSFRCYVCKGQSEDNVDYYHCPTCKKECHIGCYKYPPEIKEHPYHDPSHTLVLENPSLRPDENLLRRCICCRGELQDMYYNCYTCKFSLNATCVIQNPQPPLIIVSSMIHAHQTFTLFPRRLPLPCDACGLLLDNSASGDHVYTCLSRNYIAHGKCIKDLPCEISITRHPHRLVHIHIPPVILSPPRPDLSCGVCYQIVSVNHGYYYCKNMICPYAVHSKCATRNDVWDGKELKDVPEEPEEDIKPFKVIDVETIKHFSHEHHLLKFKEEGNDQDDGSKFCQACLVLIKESDKLYTCIQCNFILHQACASLPRKIGHQLHKHRLTLLPAPTNLYLIQFMVFVEGAFKCSGCHQRGYGFMYQCNEKGCKFQLDARCASLAQSFIHGSHTHPLFLSLTKGECMRCGSNQCSPFYLECTNECNFFLGLKCATLPSVAHYRYDGHPLHLSYGEKDTTSSQYWCEICETKLDASEWFYTCDECKVTLHVSCLLGEEAYMKPGHTIKINDNEVEIVCNKGNTRPFCGKCGDRCVDTLVFKRLDNYFCTLHCLKRSLDHEKRENLQKREEEG